jgi:putative oxidoreductase
MHPATQGSTPTPNPEAGNTDRTPSRGRPYRARMRAAARILVGLVFITAGLPKLTGHATWAGHFHHWHVPLAGLAVYAVGSFEVIGGALLALGVLTRLLAAGFTIDMTGALLFADLTDGGRNIVLPVTLGALSVLFVLCGGGPWQLGPDTRWPTLHAPPRDGPAPRRQAGDSALARASHKSPACGRRRRHRRACHERPA